MTTLGRRSGAAALTLLAMLTVVPASAASAAPSLAASAVTTTIPTGFLISEANARGPLTADDRANFWPAVADGIGQYYLVNPCGGWGFGDGRTAMRTVTVYASGPDFSGEQLVLYPSASSARKALTRLRTRLTKGCGKGQKSAHYTVKSVKVGDEALWVKGDTSPGGTSSLNVYAAIARRGTALMFYTSDNYAAGVLTGKAKTMAKKVCDLPGVCG